MSRLRFAGTAAAWFVASWGHTAYSQEPPTEQVEVTRSADQENAVDVTITLEEQDRHQLEYGGGMSQGDGVFGNASYSNPNFLGRGGNLRLFGQYGARSSTYQLSFIQPYLLGGTAGGFDLFRNQTSVLPTPNLAGYSETRSGINLTVGNAVRSQSRVSLIYSYEAVDSAIDQSVLDSVTGETPGRHVESRLTPTFVNDTRDDPFMPRRGRRVAARAALAGGLLGGTANYIRPEIDAVQYVPVTSRTALGLRLNAGWIKPFGTTGPVPYYLRYFLGGENQIRGVDPRTVGPLDSSGRIVGGDKFLLFNAEYYIDLHRRVRLVLFHDAGQAYAETQPIDARQLRSSSGVELRVVLPKLNVPIRLIYGWNTDRDVFQPASSFKFAFGMAF